MQLWRLKYYEKNVTLRGSHTTGGGQKKEVKKVKMVDVLSIQE
jgi:hypothetical protein